MTIMVGKMSLSQLEHPQFGGLWVVDGQQSDKYKTRISLHLQ